MADEPFEFFDYTTGVPLEYCSGEKIAEKLKNPACAPNKNDLRLDDLVWPCILYRYNGYTWIEEDTEEGMCVLSYDMKDTYKYSCGKWLKWKEEPLEFDYFTKGPVDWTYPNDRNYLIDTDKWKFFDNDKPVPCADYDPKNSNLTEKEWKYFYASIADENIVDNQYKEDELNFVHPEPPFKMPVYVKYDGDLFVIQGIKPSVALSTVDDLMNRDKQREKDGFPRKIKMGKIVKPSRQGKVRFVMVPTTTEEKLYHDRTPKPPQEDPQGTGSSEGEEGEVIGEELLQPEDGEEGDGQAGQGSGGEHEVESNAYELGKSLTEEFELPNIKDKAKKKAVDKYVYDLTDKHRGFGQILDKKATLKKIVETNIALGRGNLPDIANVDTGEFIVSPKDMIYRVLSRERMYESQAMVFFMRDYSGSMYGAPTDIVVGQHIMIYSWLLYQYQKNVETRFILHDTEAKEVPDFFTYYNSRVNGGTYVYSGFELINKMIEEENLARDYNIYIFYGTDGDDWDEKGEKTLENIRKMLDPNPIISRLGIVVVNRSGGYKSNVEKYISNSGMMVKFADYMKLSTLMTNASEKEMINSIKQIIR